jgi:hypothetical protein
MSCPGSYTCHSLVCPRVRFLLTTWPVLDLPRAGQSLHEKIDFRSTLLHKMTTYIIILLNLNREQASTASAVANWFSKCGATLSLYLCCVTLLFDIT